MDGTMWVITVIAVAALLYVLPIALMVWISGRRDFKRGNGSTFFIVGILLAIFVNPWVGFLLFFLAPDRRPAGKKKSR